MTSAVRALQLMTLVVFAGLATTGCGSSMSATGPSSLSGGGAVISGRVNLTGSAASAMAAPSGIPVRAADTVSAAANGPSGSLTVTVVGTNTSTTIDNGGSFTLTNVPAGTAQLHFQGLGTDAMLTISGIEEDDRIQIAVTLDGRGARLDSRERVSGGRGGRVEVNGRIEALNSAGLTIRVQNDMVFVGPSTIIRHGSRTLSFADLRVGDHIQVKGSRNGFNVTATEIKVERGDKDDEDDDDDDEDFDDGIEVRGAVSGLTGTCPALSFVVAGTRVVTNAATRFEDGACITLRNDMRVEVEGTRTTDGALLATEVERE